MQSVRLVCGKNRITPNNKQYGIKQANSINFWSFKQQNANTSNFGGRFFHQTQKKCISDELRKNLYDLYRINIDERVPNYRYDISPSGPIETKDYEVKLVCSTVGSSDFRQISPWYDITLYYFPANMHEASTHFPTFTPDEKSPISLSPQKPKPENSEGNLVHMVCEIPEGSNAKMEVNLKTKYHSIKQDITKDGELRFIKYGNFPFNYGMLPQTIELKSHLDPITKLKGDGDPIDVVEVGSETSSTGEVMIIKPICSLALIDEGETDWKVIAINSNDPLFPVINSVKDLEQHMPGKLNTIKEWFRLYKTVDGKPENSFALDGNPLDKDDTDRLIFYYHKLWRTKMMEKLIAKHGNVDKPLYAAYDPALDLHKK